MYKFIFLAIFSLISNCVKNYSQIDSVLEIKELLIQSYTDNQFYNFTTTVEKFNNMKYTPLGIRLNNYGCLKVKSNGWYKGQDTVNLDKKGHARFLKPVWGVVAFIELTINYLRKGYNTPYMFISRYAPLEDCIGGLVNKDGKCKIGYNPTMSYVDLISTSLGINQNDTLNIYEKSKLSASYLSVFFSAIAHFELGVHTDKFKIGKTCKIPEYLIREAITKIE